MKRTKGMLLRLTPEEIDTLTEKAKRTYLSREEFCRQILNNATVYERPNALFYELIKELKVSGSLLDQLVKRLDAGNENINMQEVREALDYNWNTEKMLWDTFKMRDN